MFGRIGVLEVVIIMAILVFMFGARKIPELARGMGLGIREFKKGLNEGATGEEDEEKKQDEKTTSNQDQPS
jgi:sec-independent protein translocase protein TatA